MHKIKKILCFAMSVLMLISFSTPLMAEAHDDQGFLAYNNDRGERIGGSLPVISARLTLSADTWNADFAEATKRIDVQSNAAWTASSNVSWLSTSNSLLPGTNNGQLRINITDNTTGNARTGIITVSTSGVGRVRETITVTQAPAPNDYPIVFIHGFLGWGPGQMGPFNYWGGLTNNIPRYLTNRNFPSYEAVVGPISSNRHRAIELYYFLKGGQVDYGALLSETHGHYYRYGRYFDTPLVEGWGVDDGVRVHLVGHSKGGTTARELANLIAYGCPAEIEHAARTGAHISDLLAGNSTGEIHSITTIATPNSGSTLFDAHNHLTLTTEFLGGVATAFGAMPLLRELYDFRLDHFGLTRAPGQSWRSYLDTIYRSGIWGSEALAMNSASVEAVINNRNMRTLPDIYYFSHSVQATQERSTLLTGNMIPGTNPLLHITGNAMYRYRNPYSTPRIDDSWAHNDGFVNVISMGAPFSTDSFEHRSQPYSGNPVRGEWNEHPLMHDWDHLEIVGLIVPVCPIRAFQRETDIRQFYLDMARRLHALPGGR